MSWPLGLVLLAALPPSPPARAAAGPAPTARVMVLELDAFGVEPEFARGVQQLVANSVRTLPGFSLVAPLELQLAWRGRPDAELLACHSGLECARRVGLAGQVDWVLYGTLGHVGDAFSVNLRALRMAVDGHGRRLAAATAAQENISLSGDRDQLIPAMRIATVRMLDPNQLVGALWVDVDVAGVLVVVDGQPRGTTPLTQAIGGLAPGKHQVSLRHPGWPEATRELTVRALETTRLRVDLQAVNQDLDGAGGRR